MYTMINLVVNMEYCHRFSIFNLLYNCKKKKKKFSLMQRLAIIIGYECLIALSKILYKGNNNEHKLFVY